MREVHSGWIGKRCLIEVRSPVSAGRELTSVKWCVAGGRWRHQSRIL